MTPLRDTVSLLQQYTDTAGKVQTMYICSGFGGTDVINVRGTLPTDRASASVLVRVKDLVELTQSAHDTLIGRTNQHPSNHFGTKKTIDNLKMLADTAYADSSWTLQYNDISLISGGPFDCDVNHMWDTPHEYHREGRNVDMRPVSVSGDSVNVEWLQTFISKTLKGTLKEENRGIPHKHHFHLTF